MSSQFIEPLTSNGFTEAEAHVYISLLRYGEATVTAIASETSIKRTTTYHILQSLSERGVVSSYRKKNTDWYRALRPNILVDRITKNSQSLQDLLPGLLQLTGSARHTPKMGFHGGVEGIRECYLQAYRARKCIYGFTNYEKMPYEVLDIIRTDFIPWRQKNAVSAQFIIPDSEKNRKIKMEEINYFSLAHKIIPTLPLDADIEIFMMNDVEVFFLSFVAGEEFGIHVTSSAIYRILKNLFDAFWTV